jgi:isoleucyl-tRNA synthetase
LLNNDEITSFIKDQEETILDELNIKEVLFSDEIKEFGTLTLKPNFKNMKMKFGDEMQDAMKSISDLDPVKVTKNVLNGLAIPKNKHELTKDDLIIDLKANGGSESFLGNDLIVSLDTTIRDSLRLEGVLRDLIRQIQLMRKEANFEIDDRIIISANFSDELKNIIEENKEYFMNEVLCKDIVANLENFDYNSFFKYENNEIEIYLKKL